MSKVLIDAEEVQCLIAADIRPGDVLIIVNGNCVAVQRGGNLATTVSASRALMQRATRKVAAGEFGGNLQSAADRELVVNGLREHGPIGTGQLLDVLKIDRKDDRRRRLRQLIGRMAVEGYIKPARGEANKPRPKFELAK